MAAPAAPAPQDEAHALPDPAPTATSSRRLRRLLVRSTLAVGVVATAVFGGAAIAAWNVTGEGAGSAAAASADPLTDVTVTITASLYPGLTTDASLAVTNPNPFPVRLIDIEFGTVVGSGGCVDFAEHQVTFTDITNVADTTYLIDADESETFTLTDVVAMGVTAADACQGATFTVDVDLNAESAAP